VGDATNQSANYCPLLTSSNRSSSGRTLAESSALGCLTLARTSHAPPSESRRTSRLVESNHFLLFLFSVRLPSLLNEREREREREREPTVLGSVVEARLCDSHESKRGYGVPMAGDWSTLGKKLQGQCGESRNLLHFTDDRRNAPPLARQRFRTRANRARRTRLRTDKKNERPARLNDPPMIVPDSSRSRIIRSCVPFSELYRATGPNTARAAARNLAGRRGIRAFSRFETPA